MGTSSKYTQTHGLDSPPPCPPLARKDPDKGAKYPVLGLGGKGSGRSGGCRVKGRGAAGKGGGQKDRVQVPLII